MNEAGREANRRDAQARPAAARWALLLYLAACCSLLVAHQASRIATEFNLNPRLFTAHYSSEVYRSLEDPFKPRLFAYLVAARFRG